MGLFWREMFLLNHVLTRGRHILHRTGRKQHWGLCKKEQLQLLRKQSMPMCHNSTSTFFKNINLNLKWKTSNFRSVPKTLERQLLNQNIALPFFFYFLPLSSSGHLLMLTPLVFTSLSTSDHFSCLLILRKVRTRINLAFSFSLKNVNVNVKRYHL